ncbi:sulfurtransferase [Dyadobacter psychrotolerans]|uniref:Sulfurtransferase n=1 Tax=Dyadobacter psychrotolerans TaxID=2541721 RepID=A0A4R5DIC9_9BACT|nr:sulfurtransferase [Dyadobacter psychrotolerans]TDE10253.1 sulfurtransferase [Dyadobacter psychrotolerans]
MGIISAQQLRTIVQLEDVVIADARGGSDALERYKMAHLPGALFVDLETELSAKSENAADGGRHPLPSPEKFGETLSAKGITSASTVVIYDDKNGANAAARFWWMLKAAGHEKVFVVNGGFSALLDAGFEMTSDIPVIQPFPNGYLIEAWKLPIVKLDDVARAADDKDYLVIDVRENYRYIGQSEPIDLIAGHIPGAVNIPYTSNLNEKGEFLSSSELADKYNQIGGERKLIVHCGSGVTACHTLLALSEAGIPQASLYVGSWSEWSRNDKAIETGDDDQAKIIM